MNCQSGLPSISTGSFRIVSFILSIRYALPYEYLYCSPCNKATMNMIKRIEPYVAYGYPNRKTISDLIYKRGFAKINHARIPLSDNMIIENSLQKYNINCIEDLVEEIYRVGPHFKEANSFLWTFKMNNPKGGWSNKNHSFQNGGDWGNREEEINKLIRRMN